MSKADDKIILEAQERFTACSEWERDTRMLFKSDYRFANADSYNGFQWDEEMRRGRLDRGSPCLTINKTRQHCLNITNDAKQNKPGVAIKPTGGGASFEAAQALSGIIRHIEYRSNAASIYDAATSFQVQGGWGYWRVITAYVDEDSFDQELLLEPIRDPLSVYLDPDAKQADKSDMRYAFVFEDMSLDKFQVKYPEETPPSAALDNSSDWLAVGTIRVAEYYRKVEKKDRLMLLEDPAGGEARTFRRSDFPDEASWKLLLAEPGARERPIVQSTIEWHYIVGNEVRETKIWPGRFIPIVKIVGEEVILDGKLDIRGHTRAMLDPQRIYNYWSSAAVEFGALQSKTPWVTAQEAVEPYVEVWKHANTKNYAYLPYRAFSEAGQVLPPPQRIEPPVAAPVALAGMEVAQKEMMLVSGQFDAQMGQQGNERSGKAISERQRQGDNATYHYVDNLAIGIRYTGKILLDMIPHIYDTKRVLTILAEDNTTQDLQIDPQAEQAYAEELDADNKVAQRILNPNVGRYEVQAQVGPGYATKREEAFNAFTILLTQAPQLASIIGDILFRAADFPLAGEAAERLRRMVPKEATGEGPSQKEQELQQKIEELQTVLRTTMDEMAKVMALSARQEETGEINKYKAFTERLKVMMEQGLDAEELRIRMAELVMNLAFTPESESEAAS
jgi:hypothetical protein